MENGDKSIYVSIWLPSEGFVPAGTIIFNDASGYSGFSYFDSYIANGYPAINPATLDYKTQKTQHFAVNPQKNDQMLDRAFWDILPSQGDFGTNVIIARHPEYFSMNNAQKLHFLGSRAVGGLSCYVRREREEGSIDDINWLDTARKESVSFHMKEISRIDRRFALEPLTSYGGVRPKAMYKDENGDFWIAKFNLPSDPYDMSIAEHVAMQMAKDCGMEAPETKVLTLPSGEHVFLTKRFDRNGTDRMHSISFYSLAPGVDFERSKPVQGQGHTSDVYAKIVRRFSEAGHDDMVNLVRKLLVDIAFNNTDNHLRNSRMILDSDGSWRLSPAFDIIFDPRVKPHTYSPAGLSRDETHLNNEKVHKSIASMTGVSLDTVSTEAERVWQVTERWQDYCSEANMSLSDMERIEMALQVGRYGPEAAYRLEHKKKAKISNLNAARPTPPKPQPFSDWDKSW